jgi:hypothetical protein
VFLFRLLGHRRRSLIIRTRMPLSRDHSMMPITQDRLLGAELRLAEWIIWTGDSRPDALRQNNITGLKKILPTTSSSVIGLTREDNYVRFWSRRRNDFRHVGNGPVVRGSCLV